MNYRNTTLKHLDACVYVRTYIRVCYISQRQMAPLPGLGRALVLKGQLQLPSVKLV